MANPFFIKLYMEILDDPKIYQLRPTLRWRFVECLLLAGEQRDGGYLPDAKSIAWRLRDDPEKVETDLSELGEAGLLDLVDGDWHIRQFAKRQARQYSDNPEAVRKREYRARKKELAEKKRKEKIVDIDKDMSHGTSPRDMSQKNVPNNGDPLMIPAINQLIQWWLLEVGTSMPIETDFKRCKLFEPAEIILNRLSGDLPEAKRLLKAKRQEMLRDGKTPKWLEAMVPYIVAEFDNQPEEFGTNAIRFDE